MSQRPPQHPTLESRLTDAVCKLLVTGSGGYALYNLYLEDIPKAAISGIVAFSFGLMTHYGQGLMETLGSRMKQWGKASGHLIDQAIDTRLDKTLTQLTGFHRQYLEALKARCVDLNVEGYGGLPRLSLEEIYVSLRMHPGGQSNPALQNRSLSIWDILPTVGDSPSSFLARLVAVIADPGYGKTTLMQFLTLTFSNQGYRQQGAREFIPVLLLFRDFHGQVQQKNMPTLPQLIVTTVQQLPRCEDLRASEPWFREKLQQGRCLVMLDGLDEVPDERRELVSKWANWQMQNYPCQFILTSRPHGYTSSFFQGVDRIDVLDFNNDQKRTFIEKWYRFIAWEAKWRWHLRESQRQEPAKQLSEVQARAQSQDDADKAAADLKRQLFADRSLIDLAKNPLLLTIIAVTHKFKERLPQRRLDVYGEIFKLLLEDRPYQRQTRLTISEAAKNQRVLQLLAYELTQAKITKFKPHQGAEWIKDRLAAVHPEPALTPQRFLQEIQQVSGLLAGGEGYLYEFTHKTFQEYLTAMELVERGNPGNQKMLTHFADKNWKEVVYFYALLTDPGPLIERALLGKALEKPEILYTLELAQSIANDAESIDDKLKQRLLDLRQKQEPESAEILLEQRFRQLASLSDETAISSHISWWEYTLFLEGHNSREFNSWTTLLIPESTLWQKIVDGDYTLEQTINEDITWQGAIWFCAWLATQPQLAPDDGIYDYRLPTPEELSQIILDPEEQPWTTDPKQPGNCLRIVRQRIPDRYRELVNYLASGSWQEADRETEKLMLQAGGDAAVQRRYLELEEIRNFPCEDLLLIDQLWVKFSGGKFGFSVQKQIWVEVGGKLDFAEDRDAAISAFEKMCDRNEWRVNGKYTAYRKVPFDTSVPKGRFPLFVSGLEWSYTEVKTFLWAPLLSHPVL